jgi:hypothetical protein
MDSPSHRINSVVHDAECSAPVELAEGSESALLVAGFTVRAVAAYRTKEDRKQSGKIFYR